MSERLFIITGSSRGIGKALTHAFALSNHFTSANTHFILTSTKQSDLDAAKASLEQVFASHHGNTDKLKVYTHPIDFSDMNSVETNLKTLFGLAHKTGGWKQVILVMNHGSLGGLEFIEDVSSNITQVCQPKCLIGANLDPFSIRVGGERTDPSVALCRCFSV